MHLSNAYALALADHDPDFRPMLHRAATNHRFPRAQVVGAENPPFLELSTAARGRLDWLCRLDGEPRRLWRRRLFGNARFVLVATRGTRTGEPTAHEWCGHGPPDHEPPSAFGSRTARPGRE